MRFFMVSANDSASQTAVIYHPVPERLKMSSIMLFEVDTNFVAIENIVNWNCRMFEGLII